MTRFERYTRTPEDLEILLCIAVDDALEAKGCSMMLKMPPDIDGETGQSWADWLRQEDEE